MWWRLVSEKPGKAQRVAWSENESFHAPAYQSHPSSAIGVESRKAAHWGTCTHDRVMTGFEMGNSLARATMSRLCPLYPS